MGSARIYTKEPAFGGFCFVPIHPAVPAGQIELRVGRKTPANPASEGKQGAIPIR
jgi:hypothetical protein